MTQYIGKNISLDCGDLGVFQGIVKSIDASAVSLTSTFKDGLPCAQSDVSIIAEQIRQLSFVKPTVTQSHVVHNSGDDQPAIPILSSHSKSTQSIISSPPSSHKRPARIIRAETIGSHDEASHYSPRLRRTNSLTELDSGKPAIVKKCGRQIPTKSISDKFDCFAVSTDSCIEEFDFEKNLALFDKQQVYNEIENSPGTRSTPKNDKFKHDEMIVKPQKAIRQIKISDESPFLGEYTTDEGLVIPCITHEYRRLLFEKAKDAGLTEQRICDMVGRNASDMVFQLVGGSTRLTPKNLHQRPLVVVFCGPHQQGLFGVNCARQLSNHNVEVVLLIVGGDKLPPLLEQELQLFDMCGCKRISGAKDLPRGPVDLIVNCLETQYSADISLQEWYQAVVTWCNHSKAPVLAIDPPTAGSAMETKWSLHIGLPTHLPKSVVQSYLCDVGIPKTIFNHIGIKYRCPFGSKYCIPLHKS